MSLSKETWKTIAFVRTLVPGDRVRFTAKRHNPTIARLLGDDIEGEGTVIRAYLRGGMMLAIDGDDREQRFICGFSREIEKL